FSLSAVYTFYTSPANYFSTVQEVALSLSYDDSALWAERSGDLEFALNPSVTLAAEVKNSAFGPDEGIYLELGLSPSLSVEAGDVPLSLSFPITVGFSVDDYYEDGAGEDDTFGYGKVGVALGADISESVLPAE